MPNFIGCNVASGKVVLVNFDDVLKVTERTEEGGSTITFVNGETLIVVTTLETILAMANARYLPR